MGEREDSRWPTSQRRPENRCHRPSDALTFLAHRLKNISLHDDVTLQPETSNYHTGGLEWTRNTAEDILV